MRLNSRHTNRISILFRCVYAAHSLTGSIQRIANVPRGWIQLFWSTKENTFWTFPIYWALLFFQLPIAFRMIWFDIFGHFYFILFFRKCFCTVMLMPILLILKGEERNQNRMHQFYLFNHYFFLEINSQIPTECRKSLNIAHIEVTSAY